MALPNDNAKQRHKAVVSRKVTSSSSSRTASKKTGQRQTKKQQVKERGEAIHPFVPSVEGTAGFLLFGILKCRTPPHEMLRKRYTCSASIHTVVIQILRAAKDRLSMRAFQVYALDLSKMAGDFTDTVEPGYSYSAINICKHINLRWISPGTFTIELFRIVRDSTSGSLTTRHQIDDLENTLFAFPML